MESEFFAGIARNWEGLLSLYAFVGIIVVTLVGSKLLSLIPAIGAQVRLNKQALASRMEKPSYSANQKWNRKWAIGFQVVIFLAILPFCLKPGFQSVWGTLLDCFIVLMVYDFFYYLTHRFLFHDSPFLGGPLKWMHAIHHRQHNPCRMDSSYIHPLEVAIGLGLYVATIAALSAIMGRFDVVTVVVTFVAFSQINLHNHNLWGEGRFLWGYAKYASDMHHHHHAKFTGGNFATITLLYDWMFGTLDHGEGGYSGMTRKKKA
ncbi:sterol desaturase family protein [Novosphingobium sp. TH158]|uniref:sterol desaturase family protein n=1 Tax=Novosphingobium sp. TH158 TaxID=2067455 RepID=UPI000C79C789|nr:sterol desaturase family protein [Novosphingobium sp. TH158]PLK27248.1 sterol desaturase [Novosphingobium sp. TH158]